MSLKAFGSGAHAATNNVLLSTLDGAATACNGKARHKATSDVTSVVLVYDNWLTQTAVNDQALTVTAGLETSSVHAVTVPTVATGVLTESSPLSIVLLRGDTFYSRTHSIGAHTPMTQIADSARNEGGDHSATDLSQSGTFTPSTTFIPCPAFLAAVPTGHELFKAVLWCGDSIDQGQNAAHPNDSYAVQALEGAGVPYIHAAQGSTTIQAAAAAPTHFQQLAAYCDVAVAPWGINDLRAGRTAAQIFADYGTFKTALGIPTYLVTVGPDNSGGGLPTFESQRLALNALIRAENGGGTFAGHFERADLVETSRDSGTFKATYSDDGLHYATRAIHTTVSAAITPATFSTGYVPPVLATPGNARAADDTGIVALA